MEKDYYESISKSFERFFMRYSKALEPINEGLRNLQKRLDVAFEPLIKALKPLRAYAILGENQFTYFRSLNANEVEEILSCDDMDSYLTDRIERNDFVLLEEIMEVCQDSYLLSDTNTRIVYQSIKTIEQGFFDLALVGMVSAFDGALSKATNDSETSIKNRLDALKNKIRDSSESLDKVQEKDITLFGTYISWTKTMDSFQKSTDFSKPEKEPAFINRHWVAHGRKTSCASKLDCYKMIGALYGLVLLAEACDI